MNLSGNNGIIKVSGIFNNASHGLHAGLNMTGFKNGDFRNWIVAHWISLRMSVHS